MKHSWLRNSVNNVAAEYTTKQLINLNCQLSNLIRSGHSPDSFQLFKKLHSSHFHPLKPDHYSLSTILAACPRQHDTRFGNQLHAYAITCGLNSYPHVTNTLLSFYAKSRDLDSVERVFDEIQEPDVYSWTSLLSACAKLGQVSYACQLIDEMPWQNVALWNAVITGCDNGQVDAAFGLFRRMHLLGVRHDRFTFAFVLSLCSLKEELLMDFGRSLHSLVIKTGFLGAASVANALVSMYFSHGDVTDGYCVFEEVCKEEVGNEITFNAVINGLVSLGRDYEALMRFREMKMACLRPTKLTFVTIMSSCLDPRICYQVHSEAVKGGYESCTAVSNAAMAMYTYCGDLGAVSKIFEALQEKDIVSWNTMVAAYVQSGLSGLATSTYVAMQRDGIMPDGYTVGSVLASSGCLEFVEMLHALMFKSGLTLITEAMNAVVSAFSKHGGIEQAYKVFHDLHPKNLISWNAMISGFLLNGSPVRGLEQFSKLLKSNTRPDLYTLTIVLSICAGISALGHGKQVHSYIIRYGIFGETCLGNALITMYAKCGSLGLSRMVFDAMNMRDVVSWNALISAFGQYGEGKTAVKWFNTMQGDPSIRPDQKTFTVVLSACSHAGLVDDGIRIFNSMVNDYGFEPQVDHFSCLIDLLGRAGYLDETEELIKGNKHVIIDPSIWWTLFGACAAYGNVRLGRIVAGFLLETERENSSVYVLLSNIHAAFGQWEEAADVRQLMDQVGVLKLAGCSWIRQ